MSNKPKPIKITRVYAENGKSLFGELEIEIESLDFAPPAPPLNRSPWFPAARCFLWVQPPGWVGEWHCPPARLIFSILTGTFGVEVSSGERREFSAGEVALFEDNPGQGHRSWVVGNTEARVMVVQVADTALLK